MPGRPPRGGRGLKSPNDSPKQAKELSPPSRGAWIEIAVDWLTKITLFVAPLAGGVD